MATIIHPPITPSQDERKINAKKLKVKELKEEEKRGIEDRIM